MREQILDLRRIQDEVRAWHNATFGDRSREDWPMICLGSEVGELMHHWLKRAQGIRGTYDEHTAAIGDAIGDILIALIATADDMGFDVESCLRETWATVRQRTRAGLTAPKEPLF